MNSTVIIIIASMALFYFGMFYFMRLKKQKQKDMFLNTDLNAEMNNAENYRNKFLNSELSLIRKHMGSNTIDAINYANFEYSAKSAIKDGLKDGLKGLATLGTVKFNTVQTPKYLVLCGADLHLLDTDTEGEISNQLIFDAFRLEKSSINEIQLEGTIKAFAKQKGDMVKAYKLSLATDGNPIELIIFSALLFTFATTSTSAFSLNVQKNLEEVIIASEFLKKLGDRYPNLKVA